MPKITVGWVGVLVGKGVFLGSGSKVEGISGICQRTPASPHRVFLSVQKAFAFCGFPMHEQGLK